MSRAQRIDAHQHFWQYNRARDAWITDSMKVIQRDFLPEHLMPHLNAHGIDGSISVQADASESETRFLLEWANQFTFIKGVVGWIDLQSPQIQNHLEGFSQFSKLKGFRQLVQGEPAGYLLQPEFQHGIAALKKFGYTYDLLIKSHQLAETIEFVRMFPAQPFILDHIAKPQIAKGELTDWEKQIKELALSENIYCKLSGMVTEADWNAWKPEHIVPYLDIIVNAFGTKRLVYGSDWPVCLLAASYQQQYALVTDYINSFSDSEKEGIMGANAVQFYNL